MVENNTEAVNKNTESFKKNRAAVDKLTNAFGKAVAGALQGAPKSFSEATGDLLKIFGGTGENLAKVMAGAEAYVGVWQDLTTRGINFGNNLEDMAVLAGNANMKLEDLQKIAAENSQVFAQLGASANTGITQFITAQSTFLKATRDNDFATYTLRKSLDRLGMTTDTINERFLQFDTISNIRNIRSRMDDAQRNIAATEFAKQMDRLSKLTGEQADALAKEATDISRQGNIFSFTQQIDARIRDEVEGTVQRVGKMGDNIGNLVSDLITRGFPDSRDPAAKAIYAFSTDLNNAAARLRAAALAGASEIEMARLQEEVVIEAAKLRNRKDIQDLAVLGNVTDTTGALQDLITGLNNSTETLSVEAAMEEFQKANGRAATLDELITFRINKLKQEQDNQINPDNTASDAQKSLNVYLDGLRALQQTASVLQKETLTTIFSGIAAAATALQAQAEGINPEEAARNTIDSIKGTIQEITSTLQMDDAQLTAYELTNEANKKAATLLNIANQLQNQAGIETDPDVRKNLLEQVASLTDQATELKKGAQDLSDGSITAETLRSLLGSARDSIMAAREVYVTATNVTISDAVFNKLLGYNTGTLGTTGRLFQNFGNETIAALHGIEAVVTPDQMADIVQSSAVGALRAAQESYAQTDARSSAASLTGMLNTVRKTMSTSMDNTQSMDVASLQTAISNLAPQITNGMESALSGTLKQPLTELISVTKEGVEMNGKIRKGVIAMNGDLLRGA